MCPYQFYPGFGKMADQFRFKIYYTKIYVTA